MQVNEKITMQSVLDWSGIIRTVSLNNHVHLLNIRHIIQYYNLPARFNFKYLVLRFRIS